MNVRVVTRERDASETGGLAPVSQNATEHGAARAFARFAVVGTALIAAAAAVFMSVVFPSHDDRRAVLISAGTAFVTQLAGLALLLRLRRWNIVGAWGLAAMLRFVTLAVFALVAVKTLALPAAPALFSLVTFFFLTTLAEPWLLRS